MDGLAEKLHAAMCVTQHPPGADGFPCGQAFEVVGEWLATPPSPQDEELARLLQMWVDAWDHGGRYPAEMTRRVLNARNALMSYQPEGGNTVRLRRRLAMYCPWCTSSGDFIVRRWTYVCVRCGRRKTRNR